MGAGFILGSSLVREEVCFLSGEEQASMMMDEMGCMAGMGWMMGGMAVIGIMVVVVLALGIAALIKFLRR